MHRFTKDIRLLYANAQPFFDSAQRLNRLVYFEEFTNEAMAMLRFEGVSHFTRSQKEKMIRAVNPDWVDLTIGLKYEEDALQPQQRKALQPVTSNQRKALLLDKL